VLRQEQKARRELLALSDNLAFPERNQ